MLSGLLITLDILVCVALIGVVLLQRSEGGAFGMGGGPTGLITARGAGDLLTRTTWVLFTLFLILSLGLTLLGAHDRNTSAVIEKLKLQQANPNALNQPAQPPTPEAPLTGTPPAGAPFLAPPVGAPTQPPMTAPAPVSIAPAGRPARPAVSHAASAGHPADLAATAPPAPVLVAPPPVSASPAPAPKPATDQPAGPASGP